jgi:ribose transport system substrate-binding protein
MKGITMNQLDGAFHRRKQASRRQRRRVPLAAAAVVAAVIAIAACSSPSSSPASQPASPTASPPSSGSAPSSGADTGVAYARQQVAAYEKAATSFPAPGAALDAQKIAGLKGKTVLFVPDGLVGPFVLARQSVQTALGHLGITVKTCDPNFLPTQVAACFTQAKSDGAAAVITSGIGYNLASNAYQALEAEHIPVMVSAAGPGSPANTKEIAFESGTASSSLAGTLGADQVIAASGGRATVLFVAASGAPGVENQATVTEAEFKKYCSGCTVTTVSFDPTATTQIASSVSSDLISNPSTNYILSQTDADIPYILPSVQSAGFGSKAQVISETAIPAVLAMVQRHGVSADIAFDASYIGWDAVDGVLRLLTGMPVPTDPYVPVRVFNASNLAGFKLSATMDTDPLYGSLGFEQMFYSLWGVK